MSEKKGFVRSFIGSELMQLLGEGSQDQESETQASSKPRWSGLSLEIGDVTPVLDDEKQIKAHKDKLCRGRPWSGPSLETSDVTLFWDDGK